MSWLQSIDTAGFRFVNHTLANPVFDVLMPWLSGNPFFLPVLLIGAGLLVWKGGARGRLCVAMLALLLAAGNGVFEELKHACARPRPFVDLADARLLVGRGGSFSMPSSHAGNWFLSAAVLFVYYRRSGWAMLPLALAVSFSRVYNGVHYPTDVLAGAALGAGIGFGGVWFLDALWRSLGRRWFPLWWRQLPSWRAPVFHPDPLAWQPDTPPIRDAAAVADRQWVRLGYLFIAVMLVVRVAYIASGTIQLSKDEAYQWLWSKHLALSYYSKPPLIAWLQWTGTHLWGDTELGVRFFSPVCATVIAWLVLRFMAAQVNGRAAFVLVLMLSATPLMALGSILMTIDPPLVLFWTAAMIAGWRAVQPHGRTRDWVWAGLWMGLGFLSKYLALGQWLSFLLFMALWPPARRHLAKPGPYLALLVNLACTLPVVIWNAQHHWVTVSHLEDRAHMTGSWHLTTRFFADFTGAMFGLMNPIFFVAVIWACVQVWRKRQAHPFWLYLFLMGVPVFVGHWLFSFKERVLPNWVATSVVPLFALLVAYGDARWRAGVGAVKRWLIAGLALGLPVVVLMHESNWIAKIIGRPLPPRADPLRRVRNWDAFARIVGEARDQLEREGKPAFVIGDHYGITSLVTFYLPAAKQAAVAGRPFVFYQHTDHPDSQFYFWPGYRDRKGQNAIFMTEVDGPVQPPANIVQEFESVTDLGVRETLDRGRVMRRVQLFACRGQR